MKVTTLLTGRWLRAGLGLGLAWGGATAAHAQTTITWTGAVDNVYTKSGNWNLGRVPNSTDNVVIPSNAIVSQQPVVSATEGIGVAGNITVNSGASLTLGAGSEFDVYGNLINNGTFGGAGLLSIRAGTAPHFVVSSNGANNAANTLTIQDLELISGSQTFLSLPIRLAGALKLSADLNVSTNGSLTLLSSASGTAMVVNNGTAVVNGSATVQRYIDPSLNPGQGYRHYSTPVNGNTVSDLTTAGFNPVLTSTYNGAADPQAVTPFPTVFRYDQSRVTLANTSTAFDKGWLVPDLPTTPLLVGQGYTVNLRSTELVDFRGSLNNAASTPISVGYARNAAGTANDGAAGWVFLGNPFPSPLDYSRVAAADRAGLDDAMYLYQSTGPYTGQYRTYTNGVPATNNIVAVGQAFFVRVTAPGTSGTFNFRNSQRVTTPGDPGSFQRTAADPRPLVQLDLAGGGLTDPLYLYAEAGATAALDATYDAGKLPNPTGLNLSSLASNGEALAIDGRPAFTAATVLPLAVGVPAAGTYAFTAAQLLNLPAGLDAFLRDAQTGQTVNLRTQPSYSFSVSAAQASALLTGRFSLSFAARTALAATPALTAAQVSVFPNPARARFTVLIPDVAGAPAVQAELLNALGQVVRRQSAALPAGGATLTVETAGLATGVYTLRLLAGPATLAKRVVIE